MANAAATDEQMPGDVRGDRDLAARADGSYAVSWSRRAEPLRARSISMHHDVEMHLAFERFEMADRVATVAAGVGTGRRRYRQHQVLAGSVLEGAQLIRGEAEPAHRPGDVAYLFELELERSGADPGRKCDGRVVHCALRGWSLHRVAAKSAAGRYWNLTVPEYRELRGADEPVPAGRVRAGTWCDTEMIRDARLRSTIA